MNPEIVYEDTTPSNHNTNKIIAIVSNIGFKTPSSDILSTATSNFGCKVAITRRCIGFTDTPPRAINFSLEIPAFRDEKYLMRGSCYSLFDDATTTSNTMTRTIRPKIIRVVLLREKKLNVCDGC